MLKLFSNKNKTTVHHGIMDKPLLQLSKRDSWTIGNACEGTQIFGATGSGKTSGSGQAIAKAFLRQGMGGLVLTVKPDESDLWRRYAKETGRSAQLLMVSPGSGQTFNFLDYELKRGGPGAGITENIVRLFIDVLEATESGKQSSGSNEKFWRDSLRQLLRNAIDVVVMGTGGITLENLSKVIVDAPRDNEEAHDLLWQANSFCWACIGKAEAKYAKDLDRYKDLKVAARYWLDEYPGMDERTRSNIVSTFSTTADLLMRAPLRGMLTEGSTFVPELAHQGTVIVVDMPVLKYAEVGKIVQLILKYVWQRVVERRKVHGGTKPVFLWADEAQHFITASDQQFQTTARSSRVCTVYLSQNISNYYAAMGGANPKAAVDSFLGNLQTKIFHANTDSVTNEWAEKLFGQDWGWQANLSTSQGEQQGGKGGQQSNQNSAGASQALQSQVIASEFTRLRKGGPANKLLVDAIVGMGGQVWKASQKTHLQTTFSQAH